MPDAGAARLTRCAEASSPIDLLHFVDRERRMVRAETTGQAA